MEHIAEMSLNFNIHLAILTVLRKECQTFPALRLPRDSGVTVFILCGNSKMIVLTKMGVTIKDS